MTAACLMMSIGLMEMGCDSVSPWNRDFGACTPCPTDGGLQSVKDVCRVDYCVYDYGLKIQCCGVDWVKQRQLNHAGTEGTRP